jgi:tetratricopeptide (TPR) repeat protein
MRRAVEPEPTGGNRVLWAIVAIALIAGIGFGIPGARRALSSDSTTATETPPAPTAETKPAQVAVAPQKPRGPTVPPKPDKIDKKDDIVNTAELPQLRSGLRPEHLVLVHVLPEDEHVVAKADGKKGDKKKPDSENNVAKELVGKGNDLYFQGKFTEAAQAYKQALAIDGRYAPAHKALGMIYQHLDFKQMAIDEFRAYLALVPGAADVKQRIEQLGGQP